MRFTVRTSMFALFLTYSLNWWYFKQNNGEGGVTKVDCAAYSAGGGTDKDGKPFSVRFRIIMKAFLNLIMFRVWILSTPTIYVSILNQAQS